MGEYAGKRLLHAYDVFVIFFRQQSIGHWQKKTSRRAHGLVRSGCSYVIKFMRSTCCVHFSLQIVQLISNSTKILLSWNPFHNEDEQLDVKRIGRKEARILHLTSTSVLTCQFPNLKTFRRNWGGGTQLYERKELPTDSASSKSPGNIFFQDIHDTY